MSIQFNSMASVVAAVCVSLSVGSSSAKANDFQTTLNNHLTSGDILLAQEAAITQEEYDQAIQISPLQAESEDQQAFGGSKESIESATRDHEMNVQKDLIDNYDLKTDEAGNQYWEKK